MQIHQNPVFVGRELELAMVRERLDAAHNGGHMEGLTMIVGDHGMGCTSIRRQAELYRDYTLPTNGQRLVVAHMDGWEHMDVLSSPPKMFDHLRRQLDVKLPSSEWPVLENVKDTDIPDIQTTWDFENALLASTDTAMWRDKSLVLMIDNVQESTSTCAEMLRILNDHGGSRVPVTTIGFGEPVAIPRIEDTAEIPFHIENHVKMQPFTPTEAREAATGCMAAWRLPELPSTCVDGIVEASEGVPLAIAVRCNGAALALNRGVSAAGQLTKDIEAFAAQARDDGRIVSRPGRPQPANRISR